MKSTSKERHEAFIREIRSVLERPPRIQVVPIEESDAEAEIQADFEAKFNALFSPLFEED